MEVRNTRRNNKEIEVFLAREWHRRGDKKGEVMLGFYLIIFAVNRV